MLLLVRVYYVLVPDSLLCRLSIVANIWRGSIRNIILLHEGGALLNAKAILDIFTVAGRRVLAFLRFTTTLVHHVSSAIPLFII